MPQLAVKFAAGAFSDELSHFPKKSRDINGFDKHAALFGGDRALGRGYDRRCRFVIHHTRVSDDLQARFGRFHLKIAQDELVFLFVEFTNRLGRRCGGIHTVTSRLKDCLKG